MPLDAPLAHRLGMILQGHFVQRRQPPNQQLPARLVARGTNPPLQKVDVEIIFAYRQSNHDLDGLWQGSPPKWSLA